MSRASTPTDVDALQRRVLTTLVLTQILGGVGVASGIAVMALIARALSGSETAAGLGTTFQVLGSALIAIPMARVMAARGRRPGLLLGYLLAFTGSALVIVAAMVSQFWLMLLGSLLFGGGTTSGNQARFAGVDLAPAERRGRHLSLVVWATTIGSVAGPNLVGAAESVGRGLGLPPLTGLFLFSMIGFAAAATLVALRLRPDPLLTARELDAGRTSLLADPTVEPGAPPATRAGPAAATRPSAGTPAKSPAAPRAKGSLTDGWRAVRAHPVALLGLVTMALGHAVMVSVMVMTPLHMDHGDASLNLIGLVISIHILGMFALSPVVGVLVDRFGGRRVALGAAVVLLVACLLAASTQEGMSTRLTVALFLLGLGWSGTLIAGSALLVGNVAVPERPATQGLSDLAMGLCGAGGGALAGVVLHFSSYAALSLGACLLVAGIGVASALLRTSRVS